MEEDEESRSGENGQEQKNQFRSPSSKDSLLLSIASWRGERERERDRMNDKRAAHRR
jgi:hypothetical protein